MRIKKLTTKVISMSAFGYVIGTLRHFTNIGDNKLTGEVTEQYMSRKMPRDVAKRKLQYAGFNRGGADAYLTLIETATSNLGDIISEVKRLREQVEEYSEERRSQASF